MSSVLSVEGDFWFPPTKSADMIKFTLIHDVTFWNDLIIIKVNISANKLDKYKRACFIANIEFNHPEKSEHLVSGYCEIGLRNFNHFKRILPLLQEDYPNDPYLDKEHIRQYEEFLKGK